MSETRWSFDIRPRASQVLFIIFKGDETVGSLTFSQDNKEDIELWKKVVNRLNEK